MIVNPRRFFVIVGTPHTGKRKTTQQIFGRKKFLPFKAPIKTAALGEEQFVIILPRALPPHEYLAYIRKLIQVHRESDTSFFVVLDLLSAEAVHEVQCILEYFNGSAFEVHYLVLSSSLYDERVLGNEVVTLLQTKITNGTVHVLDRLVTASLIRLNDRARDIVALISKVLENKPVYF
ncbi:MAG: hypothetical protein J7623_00470 [Chitinophaga sp.]|uniref:hypothetical protein n=1 Tax=Chitinophaga sp. TaxID=1869181 RepID=UPI001B187458|nr:hypothetical protein [Chitinophaga sp.]MBO9727088.1 hypothetical protein [Chitinophaga sp.]